MAQAAGMASIKFGHSNVNSGNVINDFNRMAIESDAYQQIMRWLSPLEPSNRHQGVRTDRFDGVGDSLLETTEWREWMGSDGRADKAVLFCSGNPGVGKTYLRQVVI